MRRALAFALLGLGLAAEVWSFAAAAALVPEGNDALRANWPSVLASVWTVQYVSWGALALLILGTGLWLTAPDKRALAEVKRLRQEGTVLAAAGQLEESAARLRDAREIYNAATHLANTENAGLVLASSALWLVVYIAGGDAIMAALTGGPIDGAGRFSLDLTLLAGLPLAFLVGRLSKR